MIIVLPEFWFWLFVLVGCVLMYSLIGVVAASLSVRVSEWFWEEGLHIPIVICWPVYVGLVLPIWLLFHLINILIKYLGGVER